MKTSNFAMRGSRHGWGWGEERTKCMALSDRSITCVSKRRGEFVAWLDSGCG